MDETQTKTPASPEVTRLQEQFEALRHLVVSILVLVIVASGTFDIYLWRQRKTVCKDLETFGPQARNLINSYEQGGERAWSDDVRARVIQYGRTHTDFAPIMAKYGLLPTAAPTAIPASSTLKASAPAPAAAPKK